MRPVAVISPGCCLQPLHLTPQDQSHARMKVVCNSIIECDYTTRPQCLGAYVQILSVGITTDAADQPTLMSRANGALWNIKYRVVDTRNQEIVFQLSKPNPVHSFSTSYIPWTGFPVSHYSGVERRSPGGHLLLWHLLSLTRSAGRRVTEDCELNQKSASTAGLVTWSQGDWYCRFQSRRRQQWLVAISYLLCYRQLMPSESLETMPTKTACRRSAILCACTSGATIVA